MPDFVLAMPALPGLFKKGRHDDGEGVLTVDEGSVGAAANLSLTSALIDQEISIGAGATETDGNKRTFDTEAVEGRWADRNMLTSASIVNVSKFVLLSQPREREPLANSLTRKTSAV